MQKPIQQAWYCHHLPRRKMVCDSIVISSFLSTTHSNYSHPQQMMYQEILSCNHHRHHHQLPTTTMPITWSSFVLPSSASLHRAFPLHDSLHCSTFWPPTVALNAHYGAHVAYASRVQNPHPPRPIPPTSSGCGTLRCATCTSHQ